MEWKTGKMEGKMRERKEENEMRKEKRSYGKEGR